MTKTVRRQLAFVIDLNKCIGCQSCTIACKRLWTNKPSMDAVYWINVESVPSEGYPRGWASRGGGFRNGRLAPGREPTAEEYGLPFELDYSRRLFTGKHGRSRPRPVPGWAPNWEEEQGQGLYPNSYFFYLPRMCNHCSKPACLAACNAGALFKRPEDGLVLLNPDRCDSQRSCVAACPYAKVFMDTTEGKADKCHGCFPRIERNLAPACVTQCTGRAMHVGFMDDRTSSVYHLVCEWKVALPLMQSFGTSPNVFYVPPFLGPSTETADGKATGGERIPADYLESLFGTQVYPVLTLLRKERAKRQKGEPSALIDLLIGRERGALLGSFQGHLSE